MSSFHYPNARPSGLGVVDERARGRTATDSDQMPITVKMHAVRSLDVLSSHYKDQHLRFPTHGMGDHNINSQQLLWSLRGSFRGHVAQGAFAKSGVRVGRTTPIFGSANGLPRSAVKDLFFAGVSKGTFVASNTTNIKNDLVTVQDDGSTTVRNTGPVYIEAGELVAVRVPRERQVKGAGLEYPAGSANVRKIVPETVPLRFEIEEFSRPIDESMSLWTMEVNSFVARAGGGGDDGSEDEDMGDAKRVEPEAEAAAAAPAGPSIKDSLFGKGTYWDKQIKERLTLPSTIDAAVDANKKVPYKEYRRHLRDDYSVLVHSALSGRLGAGGGGAGDDGDDGGGGRGGDDADYVETVAHAEIARYNLYLRLYGTAANSDSEELAIVAESQELTRAQQMINLSSINRKRAICAGKSQFLSTPGGGDLSLNLRAFF